VKLEMRGKGLTVMREGDEVLGLIGLFIRWCVSTAEKCECGSAAE